VSGEAEGTKSELETNCGVPLCLFPVANREMLTYQMEWLSKNGVGTVHIVARASYQSHLEEYLLTSKGAVLCGMNVSLKIAEGSGRLSTADALRHLATMGGNEITREYTDDDDMVDYIVLDSNTLTNYPLSKLASKHRLNGATITTVFSRPVVDEGEAKKKESEVEAATKMPALCISARGRILLKPTQQLTEGGSVQIMKRSIHTEDNFRLYSNLLDAGLYCCSGQLLRFLKENEDVHTLGQDLLGAVVSTGKVSNQTEEEFHYDAEISGGGDIESDRRGSSILQTEIFNSRVTSSSQLLNANKELPMYMLKVQERGGPHAFWTMPNGYQKKTMSVVATDVDIKDKVVMKLCSINNGCRVATKSKLNNCILMKGVVIGENCTIQNSILATGAVLEDNCNINDCLVGTNKVVLAGTKVKNEVML